MYMNANTSAVLSEISTSGSPFVRVSELAKCLNLPEPIVRRALANLVLGATS